MLDFQQKRKIRSVAYHRVTLVILFIVVLLFARSTWIVFKKKQISQEMKNTSMQNVEELRLRDRELNSKIERLNTTSGVEEEIRLKFNVVKEEENMVVIVEDEDTTIATTSPRTGFWQKLVNLFK